MIEIFVRDFLDKPHIVRMLGKLPQIHIGADMQVEEIQRHLANEISPAEFQKFEQLWSDDSYPREYVHDGKFLKIMDKS
jgi:hypothetical protein